VSSKEHETAVEVRSEGLRDENEAAGVYADGGEQQRNEVLEGIQQRDAHGVMRQREESGEFVAMESLAVHSARVVDGDGVMEGGSDLNARGVEAPPIKKRLGAPVITARDVYRVFELAPPSPQRGERQRRRLFRRPGRTEDGGMEEDDVVNKESVNDSNFLDSSTDVGSHGVADHVIALQHITLSANHDVYPVLRGEFVMIRGPSGGGKTTLLNLLGALDRPSGGALRVLGIDVTASNARKTRFGRRGGNSVGDDKVLCDLRLRKIGFVFQTFNLLSTMSAFENVQLPMILLAEKPAMEIRERAEMLLSHVGLRERMHHLPSELSGGEQQRVAIARALANKPELLLLDEPTGDLDTRSTVEVMNLLLLLNQREAMTCVMVTHNPDIECYADRILYVADGRIERQDLNYEQLALTPEKYVGLLERREQTASAREYNNRAVTARGA